MLAGAPAAAARRLPRCVAPTARRQRAAARRSAPGARASASSSEVCVLGGLATEVVQCGAARPAVRTVLVVPGNPGVAAFYSDFCVALSAELGPEAAVCGAARRGVWPNARCVA
jgi:hypothetical protein